MARDAAAREVLSSTEYYCTGSVHHRTNVGEDFNLPHANECLVGISLYVS